VVITGANSGIGFEAAKVLAVRGAHVVLAVRDLGKGADARARIIDADPRADVFLQELDLASLSSVRAAAAALRSDYPRVDVLINNAGLMFPPKGTTADGFELQFGTNHLGHFALTGLLLERLLPVAGSRVVTLSSNGHKYGARINFGDLQSEVSYSAGKAYGQSKLANLLFTYELNRLLANRGSTVAVAAHPGAAKTELTRYTPSKFRWLQSVASRYLFQSAPMGALPALRAATDPAVRGGQYYGPAGFMGQRGHPVVTQSNAASHDEAVARKLWTVSQELTGVVYPL
jgi:NAD(P)-dependent dehydrogenase (short-subunit alcohol dehydrogenase family)